VKTLWKGERWKNFGVCAYYFPMKLKMIFLGKNIREGCYVHF